MTVMTKTPTGGCCDGGCNGNCGCACCTGAPAICPQGAIARPRFFAGQLLTQEDLQLIVDYTVGKNRLHNRFLFGEGVVCGLTVTCPPCGDGTVVVAPGYALDCCGNDIYAPCRQEVDINALVRELRLRQLDGWDCGDPCKAKGCDDSKSKDRNARDSDKPPPATNHYCLYIKYHETQVEPVAPYMSDAACGAIACEPSRICEGYKFELRCTEKPSPGDVLDHVKACVGDLRAAAAAAQKAQVNSARATELRQAVALASAPQIRLEEADLQAMEAAAGRLKSANLSAEAEQAGLNETSIRRHLADYQVLAVGVARANRLDQREITEQIRRALEPAKATLKEVGAPLSRLAPKFIAEPSARAAADELFVMTERYALSQQEEPLESAEARLFAAGAPVSAKQLSQMRVDAAQLRIFLQHRLESSTTLTSCDLLDRIHAVRVGDEGGLSLSSAASASRANEELALILLEYLRDCLCLALNPACAPCDDPAVLLACLNVRDCEVIDICNMSRRFVLSPAALRYWLAPISVLGELFERFCCELEFKRTPVESSPNLDRQPALSSETSFFRTSAAPKFTTAELNPEIKMTLATFGFSLDDLNQASVLASNIGTLGLRASGISEFGRAMRASLPAIDIGGRQKTAADLASMRAEINRDVDSKLAAERDATLSMARGETTKVVEERVAQIQPVDVGRAVRNEVEAALSDDVIDKRVSTAKAVTDLEAESRRLKAELKKLSDAVKRLQR
jgi:hypothetical protein